MQFTTVWQQGSSNPENAEHFNQIRQWWANLNGKEVTWVQRLIPQIGGLNEIHWQPQRFDESFVIVNPEIRGITLYWYKPDSPVERNTTVQKLELDTLKQQLYIYPQTESELVIRVGISEIKYQTLELKEPEISVGKDNTILVWDATQQLEVKIILNSELARKLKQQLP